MRTFVVKASDLSACPRKSLLAEHYRDDGSCRCRPTRREIEELDADAARLSAELHNLRRRLRDVLANMERP